MTATEKAAALAEKIVRHLTGGGVVQVTTYARSVVYNGAKFAGSFRASGYHVEVRRGRAWDSIFTYYDGGSESGCAIRFGRYA
jgi:hypothetical protein